MKKDLTTHLFFTVAFFLLISFAKSWFSPDFVSFWIGGILGMLLPDIDYLINIYFLHPQSPTSQELAATIRGSSLVKSWDAIVRSRYDHKDLIFHTAYFQLIFLAFTFLMISSSGSPFGIGVVMAFSLHLIIDQLADLTERGGIANWFVKINLDLTSKGEKWYIASQFVALCVMAFVL